MERNWYVGHLIAGLSSVFMALMLSVFRMPEDLKRLPVWARWLLVFWFSFGLGFGLSGGLARYIGWDLNDYDNGLILGLAIGSVATALPLWIVNTLRRRDNKDLLQIAAEIRGKKSEDEQ